MRRLKAMGFSDARLAQLALRSAHVDREMSEAVAAAARASCTSAMKAMTGGVTEAEVRAHRLKLGVRPVFKRIDSCAAEFDAATPYLYSTYEAPLVRRARGRGGGLRPQEGHDPRRRAEPDRAGDRVRLLLLPRRLRARPRPRAAGFETIMVNCNPETVSTDPDTSDRLYFEPLTAEDVLEIVRREQREGRAARRDRPARRADAAEARRGAAGGGRADPGHLARQHRSGRGPRAVRAAGRSKLGLKQPANGIARSRDEAMRVAERIGYPVLLRPSYVLGGRGMEVVDGPAAARPLYRDRGGRCRASSPVLIDRYLRDAIEVDVDAICDGTDVAVCGVLQHIEEAGVHSGDSACSIPPHSLSADVVTRDRAADARAGAGAEGQGADERPVRGQGRARSI